MWAGGRTRAPDSVSWVRMTGPISTAGPGYGATNKALEILGRKKGDYDVVHPNNHVNCSQSTNDAYPADIWGAYLKALVPATPATGVRLALTILTGWDPRSGSPPPRSAAQSMIETFLSGFGISD